MEHLCICAQRLFVPWETKSRRACISLVWICLFSLFWLSTIDPEFFALTVIKRACCSCLSAQWFIHSDAHEPGGQLKNWFIHSDAHKSNHNSISILKLLPADMVSTRISCYNSFVSLWYQLVFDPKSCTSQGFKIQEDMSPLPEHDIYLYKIFFIHLIMVSLRITLTFLRIQGSRGLF